MQADSVGLVQVNYVERHFGDWARDTAHLSMTEDGAYNRLCDVYYVRETPLPREIPACCRLVRANTAPDRKAVETVLREFFVLSEAGWKHKRCDEEIEKFRMRQAKAKHAAEHRWSNATGMLGASTEHPPSNASQTPPPTTHPPTEKDNEPTALAVAAEKPADDSVPACPFEKIIEDYHALLPQCPRLLVRNNARDGLIRARWREVFAAGRAKDRDDGIQLFRELFEHVSESKFLTGRAPARNGSPPFVADLEWLMRPTNFAKVVEGKYHRG